MKQLTETVFWLTDAVGAHSYWIDLGPDRAAIVDPGMSCGLNRVATELRRAGRSPYEVTDILLTHGDVDHTGSAAEWQRRTGARTWLGAADAAVLTGVRPAGSALRRGTVRLVKVEVPGNLRLLQGDRELTGGLTAIRTPGHTGGHYAFRFENVLFVGDAATARHGRLLPMPALLMDNLSQAATDLARLRALDVDWYCCGHSDPVRRATS